MRVCVCVCMTIDYIYNLWYDCTCVHSIRLFVGSYLATKVFIGKLPATGSGKGVGHHGHKVGQ